MTIIKEGQYAIDFHAQLSSLQAFAICVAILHGREASSGTEEERNRQLPLCNPLKVAMDEQVRFLTEAITKEEKKSSKNMKGLQQSYVLNPPFSPISRV